MSNKVFLFAGVLSMLLFGCYNLTDKEYRSEGTITGADYRMCPSPCCGGWFIQIAGTTYEFDTLPSGSDINLQKEIFPLTVRLDWQLSDMPDCPTKRISILRITRK